MSVRIGLGGAKGSGKSTLATHLCERKKYNLTRRSFAAKLKELITNLLKAY